MQNSHGQSRSARYIDAAQNVLRPLRFDGEWFSCRIVLKLIHNWDPRVDGVCRASAAVARAGISDEEVLMSARATFVAAFLGGLAGSTAQAQDQPKLFNAGQVLPLVSTADSVVPDEL